MSPELIGILSVGAAVLVGMIGMVSVTVALYRGLRADITAMRSEIRAEFAAVREDVKALEGRVAVVEQGQARLAGEIEGLFVGLGNAPTSREREPAA